MTDGIGEHPAAETEAITLAHSRRPRSIDLLEPGERLAGRYRLVRQLGRGGMGVVYEAVDEALSFPLALKTLAPEATHDRTAVRRLKQEVLMARSVVHRHVCCVHELGCHGAGADAVWFLTMELLRGETLRERLQGRGRLAIDEVLPLAGQMVAGLGAAHRAGVVHRDFKSANVMIVREPAGDRAVVMDFGLARPFGDAIGQDDTRLTAADVVVGTPDYMSPEQVRGEEAGPAADVYALGVVLYEMVTGTLPFAGGSKMASLSRRLLEDAPSPRGVVPELPDAIHAVIMRCLARAPEARFAHVEEIADVLAGRAAAVVDSQWHRLPAERDVFVGREVELDDVERLLEAGSRLITLQGAGGMGKTRLAVRCGWRTLPRWPGGVWFCDLTEARDPNGVVAAVAGSLGVPLGPGDPVEQLGHAIAGRGRCLVILDNFEHVVGHAEATLTPWMTRATEARFLVTSRERLHVAGESVRVLEPLDQDAAFELFTERAQRQRPGLELQGPELESARQLVGLVEGLPLAIELAAARMRLMTAAQLVERMRERFRVLAGGERGRHATLKTTLDGSWELLTPWEQAALAQCTVFEGGFTLEAAEAVLDMSAWDEAPWVVDVLQSLTDKSLLRIRMPEREADGSLPEARFGMYVSVQEYARAKLRDETSLARGAGGAAADRAAELRHGAWYARHGTDAALEALDLHGGMKRRRSLSRELDNLLAACRRAIARDDGVTTVACYRAVWAVLELRGPAQAGVELGNEVLRASLERADRARAVATLGRAASRSGRANDARAHLETALDLHREMGERRAEGVVLGNLGTVHLGQARMDEARACFEAALAIHREVGDRRNEGVALGSLGIQARERGRLDEARAYYDAALVAHREVGDMRSEGIFLSNLAVLDHTQGRMEDARAHYQAALAIHRAVGDRRFEGVVLGDLGALHVNQGRMEEASAFLEAALAIDREVGNRRLEGVVIGNLGVLHMEQGRLEQARERLEAAITIHHEMGNRRLEGAFLGNLGELHVLEGRLEDARVTLEAALAIHRDVGERRLEGVVMGRIGSLELKQGQRVEAREALTRSETLLRDVGDPIELGKALCCLAALEHETGNLSSARARLSEAEALASSVGAGPDSDLGRELASVRQAIETSTRRA